MQSRAEMMRKNSHTLLLAGDKDEGGTIDLLYYSGWQKPCIHYRVLGTEVWTTLPGEAFVPNASGDGFSIKIQGKGIEFVCNDGVPSGWDKAPGDKNYFINNPGRYTLKNGKIEQQLSPPKAPTLVVASEVGSTTVALSWNPPEGMEPSEIGGYIVYRDGEKVYKGDAGLTWVDSGLKGNQEYTYEVATVNVQGTESPKCLSTTVRTNMPGKPGPPAWLKVSATAPDFVQLFWKAPLDHGGASVTAYNIWRRAPDTDASTSECVGTVIGRDVETGKDRDVLEWKDTDVKEGAQYLYQVSAVHLPDQNLMRSKSQAQIVEELRKKASNSLLSVDEDVNEGPLCDDVVGKAAAQLKAPRMGDTEPHIMLQAFNWESCHNKNGWYNVVKGAVPKMKEAGIDMAWLPPPSQCVDDRGYLPSEWYNLNSKYGSDADLRSCISEMVSAGISPIADVVINHRCASKQDGNGKWTSFRNPDWEAWAICNNDPSGTGQGAASTGQNIEYAPDIDHTNQKVQEDSKAFIKWLMDDVGFRAIRLDFVLGYGAWFQEQYVRAVGNPYAVAEYWHGDVQVLKNYINATKGVVAVFDFPVYYTLKNAIHSNDFSGLNWGGTLPGVMGSDPMRSVTFVENHDTSHLAVVGGKFGDNNQVCRAYAFLLTHSGIPSIFWSDWSDRGPDVQKQLVALCQVRKSCGVHCTSRVNIVSSQGGLFASYIDGKNGTIAFKMGSNDWGPGGDGWKVKATGHEYCVWAKGGL
mmetsp:Transcript_12094/g.34559  ORF Transcript_12094/g.34559 Transcript_12094/m.34559 type:complete len:748 (+) Transcript_12094:73-2316(+)